MGQTAGYESIGNSASTENCSCNLYMLTLARGLAFGAFAGFGIVSLSVNVRVFPSLDDLHLLITNTIQDYLQYSQESSDYLKISRGPVISLALAIAFLFVSSFSTNIAATDITNLSILSPNLAADILQLHLT